MRLPRSFRLTVLLSVSGALFACSGTGSLATPDLDDVAGWVERVLIAEDARDATDPILTEALVHPAPAVRFATYRALGRIGDVSTLPRVVQALGLEVVPQLRSEAIFAMARTEHPAIVEAVERFILTADARTRADFARALGMSGDERGLISLLDALDDEAAIVRGAAALGLARMLGGRADPFAGRSFGSFRSLAERMTSDQDPEVRWRAAYACRKLGAEEFRPKLLQALADPDPRVRLLACEGLGQVGAFEETSAALVEVLGDGDWRVAAEAAKALSGTTDPSSATALLRHLAAHPSHHVRAVAARSLEGAGALPGVAAALELALSDPSPTVRGEAVEAWAKAGAPDAVSARFTAMLADGGTPPTKYLRSRIARAASGLPDERGFEIVRGLLRDEEIAVRTAALAALAAFPERASEVLPPLKSALLEHDLALREAAATATAALSLRELLPDLMRALEDSDGPEFIEARLSLIRAIGALAGMTANDALLACLEDDEEPVRAAARSELARIGGSIPSLPRRPPPPRAVIPRYGIDFTYEGDRPRVRLVTNRGPFELELMPDEAPHHARAFLDRCVDGFYDGLTFHRLVPGFVVQGLDPRGDGYGTGGASLRSEVNPLLYERGMVGMPDAGLDTGGCQMFVTFRPQPRLDARYTIFARVVDGMDVVEQLDVGDRVDYVIVSSQAPAASNEG